MHMQSDHVLNVSLYGFYEVQIKVMYSKYVDPIQTWLYSLI